MNSSSHNAFHTEAEDEPTQLHLGHRFVPPSPELEPR